MKPLSKAKVQKLTKILYPLKPSDESGEQFITCVQGGKVTDNPDEKRPWTELRVERSYGDTCQVIYAKDEVQSWEVYRGKFPTNVGFWIELLLLMDAGRTGRIIARVASAATRKQNKD